MAIDSREGSIAARLRATLARLKTQDPFQVLGIPFTAEGDVVRQAFLSATKRHHPNRHAREGADVRDLATEVFLLIRAAYEQLANENSRANWRARVAPATPVRVTPVAAAPARATPATPSQAVPSPVVPRPTGPVGIPPAPWAPPSAPVTPQAPVAPPSTASSAPPARPAEVRPVAIPRRRDLARTRPPVDTRVDPVQAMLDAAKTRAKRFDEAVALLAGNHYQEAREAFFRLASEDPQNRRYRIQLHVAWGHEHREAQRGEDAIREYQRALQLDPTLADVADALKKLEEQKRSGGIFSKFFGR